MCLAFALAAIGAIFDMHTRLGEGTCPTMTKPLARQGFFLFFFFLRRDARAQTYLCARGYKHSDVRT